MFCPIIAMLITFKPVIIDSKDITVIKENAKFTEIFVGKGRNRKKFEVIEPKSFIIEKHDECLRTNGRSV